MIINLCAFQWLVVQFNEIICLFAVLSGIRRLKDLKIATLGAKELTDRDAKNQKWLNPLRIQYVNAQLSNLLQKTAWVCINSLSSAWLKAWPAFSNRSAPGR